MLDEPDINPFNLTCTSSPSGKCTLRAAIMDANFAGGSNTIILPANTYILTRPGYDDAAFVGDLDIAHDLTIQGAGSGTTIIDGNGAVTHDRVFKILASTTNVTMTGMTIRNGQSFSSTVGTIGGGGLLIEGAGHLNLSDVIFDSNQAQNGGGLYANFTMPGGSMEMNNVIFHANTAKAGGVGAGGGVFVSLFAGSSRVGIQNSQVYSNTADGTGGGLFVSGSDTAQWSIQHSEIYSNTATSAGGIGNFAPLVMTDSNVHNNTVTLDGGAMEAFSPYVILRTTIDSNTANRFGGGIFNLATGSGVRYNNFAHIEQSTLSHNWAQYGGGIYHDGYIYYSSLLTLINSTLSGNGVFRPFGGTGEADGGGMYVYNGQAELLNTTVASNQVLLSFRIGNSYNGIGGGVYITATSTFTAENSIIAKNVRGNGIVVPTPDDCYTNTSGGPIAGELGFDLILTMANCFITGPQVGNIVGQDPILSSLQNNGGTTQTQALLTGSPAIDAGTLAGCFNDQGAPLAIDERSFLRPPGSICDMGAYEYGASPPFGLYLPLIER